MGLWALNNAGIPSIFYIVYWVFYYDYMSKLFSIFYLAHFTCFYPSKHKAFPPNVITSFWSFDLLTMFLVMHFSWSGHVFLSLQVKRTKTHDVESSFFLKGDKMSKENNPFGLPSNKAHPMHYFRNEIFQ